MNKGIHEYSTPHGKLFKRLLTGRDEWKRKCADAKRLIKGMHTSIADLRKSRQHWKQTCKQTRLELRQTRAELEELKTATR